MKGIPESGCYMKLVMVVKAEICSPIGRTNLRFDINFVAIQILFNYKSRIL